MNCVRVRIEGRVQGVAYRAWVHDQARQLGLSGWVRNRRDGSVEALVCGEDALVRRALNRFEDGPPAASVTAVRTLEEGDGPAPDGFSVRETV